MTNVPHIWTTKGNMPVDALTYEPDWDINDERIIFTEVYKLGEEIVRKNSHVKVLVGASAISEAGI